MTNMAEDIGHDTELVNASSTCGESTAALRMANVNSVFELYVGTLA